jgi:transglutaminase-like putative cysteine protease
MRKIVNLLFPKENQASLELLFIAALNVFFLVIGLNELVRGVNFTVLLGCGLIGLLVTWKMFSNRGKFVLRVIILILLGVFFSVLFINEVGNSLLSWLGNFIRLVPVLLSDFPEDGLIQLQQASVRVSFTLGTIFSEVAAWWGDLMSGSGGFNEQATILIWNYIVWVLAAWLGWAVRWIKKPFAVIVPVMGVVTLVVAYIKANTWVLSIVLAICLVLVVYIQHNRREQDWERRSISYSEYIRTDIIGFSLVIAFSLVVLTNLIPSISLQELVNTFRDFNQDDESTSIAPAIGLYEVKPQKESTQKDEGILPTSHLIGTPPELLENVVMYVQASDDFVTNITNHPYWRSHTYEIYTGKGWLAGDVQLLQMNPEEELPLTVNLDNTRYKFTFSLADDAEKRLYYTGQIITTNRPFGFFYRIPLEEAQFDDLYAGQMDYRSYQAEIAWPLYFDQTLFSASQDYPMWILERYLQLPSNLPSRLYDLADQITQGTRNRYTRAIAIERYLRNYPYTLEVSPPPKDRDVVDYFLFDAQEGYCDYFASAMVVLSRAAGLPARLVVGYASGNYDSDQGIYEVIRADAHSWAEIYFPGIGWVEFEPTSSRSLIDRTSEDGPESVPDKDFSFPQRSSFIWRKVGFSLVYISIGLLFVLGMAVGVDFYTLGRKPVEKAAVILYNRLIRFSRWSKFIFNPSWTPYEFADHYKNCIRELWSGSRFAGLIEAGGLRIDYLTKNCVLAVYGVNALDEGESEKLFAAWITLLPLLLASWGRTRFRKSDSFTIQETQT